MWRGPSHLLAAEVELWRQLSVADPPAFDRGRPTVPVAGGGATREEIAGGAAARVGKLDSGSARWPRRATVVGPRPSARRYHDHERIGADRLTAAGSEGVTVDLLRGTGRASAALLVADNV